MTICTNCNGKGYNTVYKGEGGYTDFGPMKYIETLPMGIHKVPCSKCQVKEEVKDIEKETTGQTVYEQLQEIANKIGDKTLSFGCKLLRHSHDGFHKEYYILGPGSHSKRWISSQPFGSMDLKFDENMISKSSGDWYEIIGHPVMIGDVLDYFQSNSLLSECIDLLGIWNNKRKPINDQSPETIKSIWEIVCK